MVRIPTNFQICALPELNSEAMDKLREDLKEFVSNSKQLGIVSQDAADAFVYAYPPPYAKHKVDDRGKHLVEIGKYTVCPPVPIPMIPAFILEIGFANIYDADRKLIGNGYDLTATTYDGKWVHMSHGVQTEHRNRIEICMKGLAHQMHHIQSEETLEISFLVDDYYHSYQVFVKEVLYSGKNYVDVVFISDLKNCKSLNTKHEVQV